MLRTLTLVLLAAAALAVLPACVPSGSIRVTSVAYVDGGIRLDRQPSAGLVFLETELGFYSDGTAEDGTDSVFVSELYLSNISGHRLSNLPLSDCLWLATNEEGNGGDSLAMSWETEMTFRQEDEVSPNPVRMCRLTDLQGNYVGISVGGNAQALKGHAFAGWTFNYGSPPPRDLAFFGSILTAHRQDPPDSYGRCPGGLDFHFTGAEVHVPQDSSYGCANAPDNIGETIICAKRCAYRPPAEVGDAISLRLGYIDELDFETGDLDITVVPEIKTPRWMRPNLLLARGKRTIARQMQLEGSGNSFTYRWRTPVSGAAADPLLSRWHETFSPNLVVVAVRFFALLPNGIEVPLDDIDGDGGSDIADNQVTLSQMNITTTCPGAQGDLGRSFDIEACELATPTYLHRQLLDERGNPLTEPLTWEVTFLQDPLLGGPGEVFMEIDLRSEFGEAGMMGQPLMVDLGAVPVDRRASDWVDIVNIGGPRLVVEELSLEGPDAAEFSYQLPVNPRPVPVPVDFTEADGEWTLSLGVDYEEVPFMELWEDEEQGLTVVRELDLDGQTVQLYGDEAIIEDGLIVALDPSATFSPPLDEAVHRYVSRTAFDLETLPVELASGDALRVQISARPQSYSTQGKTADLRVRAHPLTDPSNQLEMLIALNLRTLWGPDARTTPRSTLPFVGDSFRNVMLDSVGDELLVRTWIAIEGPDFDAFALVSQNPTTKVIPPGETEAFTLEYTTPPGAPCGPGAPLQEARLRIATDVGDYTVELRGEPSCPP